MTPLRADNIKTPHGFFTRTGGVSTGIYASLNCGYGSGDEREKVRENRRRVAAHFDATEEGLLTLYQAHTSKVVTVMEPFSGNAPEADALVTTTPGLVLGILTADCAPVLFADRAAGIIGAAHAGWKGAHSGVLENTVAAMKALGAEAIAAAIGPCIAQSSYEVGPEFVERIADAQFFIPGKGDRSLFDLRSYVARRLRAAGIADLTILPHDTCAEEETFFSYRRATLRTQVNYGRQISCITLTTSA